MNRHLFPTATRHALRATVLAALCAVPLAQAATSFYASEQKNLTDVSGGSTHGSVTTVTEANRRTYTPTRGVTPGTLRVTRAKTTQNYDWDGADGTTTYPPVIENFDKTYPAPSFPAGMAMAATGTSSGVSAAGVLQFRAIDEYNFGQSHAQYQRTSGLHRRLALPR
jgi:hypothetical protein